jgi:adenosylhomocysteine nucleosidase
MWRTVFRQWVQETTAEAVQEQLAQSQESPQEHPDVQVAAAIICALAMESGGVEDRLDDKIWVRAAVGKVVLGRAGQVPVALVTAGPGAGSAAAATEAVIAAHRPRLVVAAGFAGALRDDLRRYHILLPNEVMDLTGRSLKLPNLVQGDQLPDGVHIGKLISVHELVRDPQAKRELGERFGALAVNLETFAVAETCRRLAIPMAAVKVITDTPDEILPPEVAYLMRARKWTEKMGAVAGAVWHRPGSLKDLWRLQEVALRAGDVLAEHVLALVQSLTPSNL